MKIPEVLKEWAQARWPFMEVSRIVLEEEIPGGSSFSFSFGSAIAILFVVQAVTGVMQLFFYVPSVKDAYLSLGYFQTQIPFGWLIHGLHYWGAQLLIILMFVHLTRVFLWGAYKSPRELNWMSGVCLLLIFMAFSLTGATLPWDQKGYWAGQVSTSVAGLIPFVGNIQKILLRGGHGMGQLTISRFFGLHVAVLPLLFGAFFAFHMVAMRRTGISGPWQESKRTTSGPFWPDQVLKDSIVFVIVFIILLTLVVFVPYQFSGPADPFDTSFVPKPEWNFLFLYEALKFFHGPLEPWGAAGVPGLLVLLLLALPFVDRNPERNPFRRPAVIISGFILAALITALSIAGYLSPGYGTAPAAAPKKADKQQSSSWSLTTPAWADEAPLTPPKSGVASSTDIPAGDPRSGEELYKKHCQECHGADGKHGRPNPGSTDGTVPILNPIASDISDGNTYTFAGNVEMILLQGSVPEGPSPTLKMPPFGEILTRKQIADLVSYVLELNGQALSGAPVKVTPPKPRVGPPARSAPKGEVGQAVGQAAYLIGSAAQGEAVFGNRCSGCHGDGGRKGLPNAGSLRGFVPTLDPLDPGLVSDDPVVFAENIDRKIQHGSVPKGSPDITMPAFGDNGSLNQQKIANLIAYVIGLNGVDRAKLVNPGIQPRTFYFIAVGFLLLVCLILAGAWSRMSGSRKGENRERGND